MTVFDKKLCKEQPRADMFLPSFLKWFSFFLFFLAIALLVGGFLTKERWLLPLSPVAVLLGVGMYLSWKNQTVRIIDANSFEYTTFMGKTTRYRFSDIKELRRNADSCTLYVGDGKVHMERMACISSDLIERIEDAVIKLGDTPDWP